MSFTLKVRYRDAAVSFVLSHIARLTPFGPSVKGGQKPSPEENRCARERAFNVKIAPADSINSF